MTAAAGPALAVFDLDGTVTRFDTLLPFLARCLARRPWRLPRLLLTLPPLLRFVFGRDAGELKGAVIHALLGGLTRDALAAEARRFAARLVPDGVYAEALAAIDRHRAQGDRLLLMSASTELYVPQVAAALGFPPPICTRLRWHPDGRLEGHLAGPNCRGEHKKDELCALIERDAPRKVYAYGNSAADLAHLQLAQEAYLVNGPRHPGIGIGPTVHRLRWRH